MPKELQRLIKLEPPNFCGLAHLAQGSKAARDQYGALISWWQERHDLEGLRIFLTRSDVSIDIVENHQPPMVSF